MAQWCSHCRAVAKPHEEASDSAFAPAAVTHNAASSTRRIGAPVAMPWLLSV